MSESIHGHDVMHMMLEYPNGFTRESLISTIQERFGETTTFHTCSAHGMSAADLVDFLETRGKFSLNSGERFNTESSKICNH